MVVTRGMHINFYWFNKLRIYCWLPRNKLARQHASYYKSNATRALCCVVFGHSISIITQPAQIFLKNKHKIWLENDS